MLCLKGVITTFLAPLPTPLPATKALGQHFLLDMNITRKIVRACGDLVGKHALEVGPGPGGLTAALLESALASLQVIELDTRCLPPLLARAAVDGRLQVHHADALKFVFEDLQPQPTHIIANLPYNVGTPLLLQWLPRFGHIQNITVMLQKEVVERLVAPVGGKIYGRLSVMAQAYWQVKKLFDVPASAFVPPPKVTSSIVQLVPRLSPANVAWRDLERVVALTFNQRRKMIRKTLLPLVNGDEGKLVMVLKAAGLAPTLRPEELTVQQFTQLTRQLNV